MPIRILSLAVLLITGVVPGVLPYPGLAGQEPPDSVTGPQDVPDTAAAPQDPSPVPEPPIPPGRAFLRALAVPGWGHASIGSYTRGGFYFATEAATAFMLVRVAGRRGAATDALELRVDQVERQARAEGVTDPAEIQERVDADPGVDDAERLVESRDQQFEDWLALGIFLVLLGGADAYVSAHLADFPDPVGVRPVVTEPGRYGVAVSVPVGGRPGR